MTHPHHDRRHPLKTRADVEPPVARPITATVAHYGWTRTFIYERLRAGDLEAVKAGRRTLITTESADGLYRNLPRAFYGPFGRGAA